MKEYLESVVSPLLSKPESLTITQTADDMGVLLVMDVDKEDMGQVIGKMGANILAIRRIIGMFGLKNSARISVKVNEPKGGKFNK